MHAYLPSWAYIQIGKVNIVGAYVYIELRWWRKCLDIVQLWCNVVDFLFCTMRGLWGSFVSTSCYWWPSTVVSKKHSLRLDRICIQNHLSYTAQQLSQGLTRKAEILWCIFCLERDLCDLNASTDGFRVFEIRKLLVFPYFS